MSLLYKCLLFSWRGKSFSSSLRSVCVCICVWTVRDDRTTHSLNSVNSCKAGHFLEVVWKSHRKICSCLSRHNSGYTYELIDKKEDDPSLTKHLRNQACSVFPQSSWPQDNIARQWHLRVRVDAWYVSVSVCLSVSMLVWEYIVAQNPLRFSALRGADNVHICCFLRDGF